MPLLWLCLFLIQFLEFCTSMLCISASRPYIVSLYVGVVGRKKGGFWNRKPNPREKADLVF